MAKSELLASMWKGESLFGKRRTGLEVMVHLRVSKASCCDASQCQMLSFVVRSNKGCTW